MEAEFSPSPNKTAVALIAGKKPVAKSIFNQLLPELRARAFTIAGIESANALQAARDAVAAIPQGTMMWGQAKAQIADELDPYLGDGAQTRAELVLRVNGYQAFSASLYNTAQADDDTTHLQYLHGECKMPTPSHEALNGVILPKDDPFWQTHTGPWGHLGCVCYVRPMNEDLVADQREEDKSRNPDDRNVIEGPALRALQHGDLIRKGRHFNVSPSAPENSNFSWSPGDLHIPLKALEAKYDPETWDQFQGWAQKTKLNDKTGETVWGWLNSSGTGVSPVSSGATRHIAFSGEASSRIDTDAAMAQLKKGFQIKSDAGLTVQFGTILHGHFQKSLQGNPSDARARFLPAAKAAAQHPIEVWENNHRHYYIARFKRPGSKHTGFVVVAARIGETADEAITFFPKTENELKKFQTGKLIYQK